jgi:hypothetical protein
LPLINPELYNIESDPEESYECSAAHPEVVKDIQDRIQTALFSFPARVQTEWAITRARRTDAVPPGAMPTPK